MAKIACSPMNACPEPDAEQDTRGECTGEQPAIRSCESPSTIVRSGAGVFPLGDRHRRRRVNHRHQPVQPARRRGKQDRDREAHDRVRGERLACPPRRPSSKKAASSSVTDDSQREALGKQRNRCVDYICRPSRRSKPGDYFALLAYVESERAARGGDCRPCAWRSRSQASRDLLGFGPRFLHSTGQAYKGGPNTGVFLQITCDDAVRICTFPGQKYTFLASSRRRRPAATSRSRRRAGGGRCACISGADVAPGLAMLGRSHA